jgi:hypothetical protein
MSATVSNLRIKDTKSLEQRLGSFHILGSVLGSHADGAIQAAIVARTFGGEEAQEQMHLRVVNECVLCEMRLI